MWQARRRRFWTTVGSTHAQMGGQGCGPLAILHDLDLTDEQLEKLAELKLEGVEKFHSI